jgi:hypothetical protein
MTRAELFELCDESVARTVPSRYNPERRETSDSEIQVQPLLRHVRAEPLELCDESVAGLYRLGTVRATDSSQSSSFQRLRSGQTFRFRRPTGMLPVSRSPASAAAGPGGTFRCLPAERIEVESDGQYYDLSRRRLGS